MANSLAKITITTHAAKSGKHIHDTSKTAHLAHLFHTFQIVLKIKLRLFEFFCHLKCLFFVDLFAGFLDQAEYIPHTKDSGSHTIRIKLLQI